MYCSQRKSNECRVHQHCVQWSFIHCVNYLAFNLWVVALTLISTRSLNRNKGNNIAVCRLEFLYFAWVNKQILFLKKHLEYCEIASFRNPHTSHQIITLWLVLKNMQTNSTSHLRTVVERCWMHNSKVSVSGDSYFHQQLFSTFHTGFNSTESSCHTKKGVAWIYLLRGIHFAFFYFI